MSVATKSRMVGCALGLACLIALNLPVWAKDKKIGAGQHIPVIFVKGIPVARFNTNLGPMWMVLDSGSNSTYFTEWIIRTRHQVCFQGAGCTIAVDVNNHVRKFALLLKHVSTPVINGMVGEDVLSRFKEVRLDYGKQEVVLVTKGRKDEAELRNRNRK